jgi:hypothetical protein
MSIPTRNALSIAAATAVFLSVASCSGKPAGAGGPTAGGSELHAAHHATGVTTQVRDALSEAKAATAVYRRPQRAEADEYAVPPAPAPLHECIRAEDGHAAMGVHHIKAANLDATLDAGAPEVLVYEPTEEGKLRLVALEYVVFEDAWKAKHGDVTPQMAMHGAGTPRLFGRDLTYVGAGNRYELPPFYQIHAWVWKHNPDGMFADHNPRVSCPRSAAEESIIGATHN